MQEEVQSTAADHNLKVCPICSSHHTALRFFYRGSIPISGCNTCGAEFCSQLFSSTQLADFYGGSYFSGDYGYRDYESTAAMKEHTFSQRLIILEDALGVETPNRPRTLLDVGCADGLMVRVAESRGWKAWGIDISESAIEKARAAAPSEESRNRLIAGVLEQTDFQSQQFDAVIMSDMIEHVHNPHSVLSRANSLIRPGGVLLIETPNLSGLLHTCTRRRWPMYRPPEHLLYFTPTSLADLVTRERFRVVRYQASTKAFSLGYLADKLRVTNPLLAKLTQQVAKVVGRRLFWLPSGSFWLLGKKNESAD